MRNISTKFALTLILHSFLFSVIALGNPNEEDKKAVKIRTQLMRLGVGEQAKIEIKLKNGSKLKGYLQEVKESDFTVIDAATNNSVTIPYPQVQKAKGHNLITGTKIHILILIGVVALLFAVVVIEGGKS